jgi:hypothetical protein
MKYLEKDFPLKVKKEKDDISNPFYKKNQKYRLE